MAVDIVKMFPERATKSGKGYVSNNFFLSPCNYPKVMKNYTSTAFLPHPPVLRQLVNHCSGVVTTPAAYG